MTPDQYQRVKTYGELTGIVVFCILMIGCITGTASAYTYTLGQGDIAYMNDTVDVSLVVAWPDFQLAWCSNGEPGCGSPTVWDMSNGNMHKVWLDKNIYKAGNYYRWDGEWHSAENAFAFTILDQPRPKNETVVTYDDIHFTTEDKVTMPAKVMPNTTSIYIARGDALEYQFYYPKATSDMKGYIWLFGESKENIIGSEILGSGMSYRSNDSVYTFPIEYLTSEGLMEGKYTGYVQFDGSNGYQDVFYREGHKVDGIKRDILDTPYDDEIIPDVPLEGFVPARIKEEFDKLEMYPLYCDDWLVPITMDVVPPYITFTDYYEAGDNLTISGMTSASPGTTITVKLNPQKYVLKEDVAAHTWTTTAIGTSDTKRMWNISVPVDWDEINYNANNTVVVSIDKYRYHTEMNKDFKVTDVFVMPTITPEKVKRITTDYGWHTITPNQTPTPEPTPRVELVPVTPRPTMYVLTPEPTLDPNVTIQLKEQKLEEIKKNEITILNETKVVTTVQTTAIPKAKDTIPTIPISPIVVLVAIGVIVLFRRWE